ncbi:LOW QUALITY PROTEIN: hypothetical protein PHMEG_00013495 [Phytophthora megakarya]|uniref:Uncharacterized protein n=1 Tax=Phytophthora megakarya TaxID=4795 RepID=A0A225W753_9STRA|nr:LOW QUALITY PROTEIN: hypothetical protein PHMEG_00013495 [Phytophthora megakarya]
MRCDLSNVALKKRAEAQQDLDVCDQKSHEHDDTQMLQRQLRMSAHIPIRTPDMPSPVASSPTKSPLSVQRPTLSPRKRKFSDAFEAASPTSLVANSQDRVISPKKKVKADSGDQSKWESHVVASIANALDLDRIDKEFEPIAFSAAPSGDLTSDELEMLQHFLA